MLTTRAIRAFSSAAKRRPIVGGNWKCNPAQASELPALVANINACDTSKCDVYVSPSPLHVGLVHDKFTNGAKVAPQNCNFAGCGAYTGEMSADQMAGMGISWVLLGHSERRGEFGLPTPKESDALLATKLKCARARRARPLLRARRRELPIHARAARRRYALGKGLSAVLCIGEPLPVREKGLGAVLDYCVTQLEQVKDLLDPAKVVIAYEPVWAIGTGVTASPEQAQETHAAIRGWISDHVSPAAAAGMRIQYGGSANAKNAPELSACPDIDGFLVGGASLKPEFKDIVAAISAA